MVNIEIAGILILFFILMLLFFLKVIKPLKEAEKKAIQYQQDQETEGSNHDQNSRILIQDNSQSSGFNIFSFIFSIIKGFFRFFGAILYYGLNPKAAEDAGRRLGESIKRSTGKMAGIKVNENSTHMRSSNTHKKVPKAYAVTGAIIIEQDGEWARIHEKCDVCGYVSNNVRAIGISRVSGGSSTTGFKCSKCNNSQNVELKTV